MHAKRTGIIRTEEQRRVRTRGRVEEKRIKNEKCTSEKRGRGGRETKSTHLTKSGLMEIKTSKEG